ncbi:hypothetical protein [Hyphomicrobium sp. DY-1]|uniref:hypothetical protein n=1 Tax=Hyphomicrobium sp. DY-1 TaxID=3075650 RepID=UPI0039C39301
MRRELGYFPHKLDMSFDDIIIATLPELQRKIEKLQKSEYRDGDWILAPGRRRVFAMPKTHEIGAGSGSNMQRIEFMVWCLGFLVGMRLTTAEAGFLDATPCRQGCLVDFVCTPGDLTRALTHCNRFYADRSGGKAPGLVVSVIHALFVSGSPHLLCYERLQYLYTALDACWKASMDLKQLKKQSHGERIEAMCQAWQIAPPAWALYDKSTNNCQLSELRNAMIHEGLVGSEPLGFRIIQGFDGTPHPLGNPLLEVEHLVSRLLVSIMGIPASSYIGTPMDTRSILALEVTA